MWALVSQPRVVCNWRGRWVVHWIQACGCGSSGRWDGGGRGRGGGGGVVLGEGRVGCPGGEDVPVSADADCEAVYVSLDIQDQRQIPIVPGRPVEAMDSDFGSLHGLSGQCIS